MVNRIINEINNVYSLLLVDCQFLEIFFLKLAELNKKSNLLTLILIELFF